MYFVYSAKCIILCMSQQFRVSFVLLLIFEYFSSVTYCFCNCLLQNESLSNHSSNISTTGTTFIIGQFTVLHDDNPDIHYPQFPRCGFCGGATDPLKFQCEVRYSKIRRQCAMRIHFPKNNMFFCVK